MMITSLLRPIAQTLAVLSLISLAGCGGGGGGSGGSSSSAAPDTTPNAFIFTSAEKAEVSTIVTSPAVTIAGINTATQISITGGEYSINGGAFTSSAGTISNGQTLTVRTTASDKTNTPKEITVTVGGVSAKFVVTTLADTTPAAFSFTAKTDIAVNTEHTSETITIKGIDIAVPVSITGGLYSINGGEFTSAAGTVSADQTITVKTTAANITDTTQNAVLTVGNVSGTFAVTTIPDTTPPAAEFKFPTPYTMSEANSVKVRGTATDDHAIMSVKVVVTNNLNATMLEIPGVPKAEGDFSSWTADVPLTPSSENEIKVMAMDDRNNLTVIDAANKVTIRQADVSSAFPDEDNQFEYIFQGLAVDNASARNRLLITDDRRLISVDVTNGKRSKLIEGSDQLMSIALDPAQDKLYVSSENSIIEYTLSTGERINKYITDLLSTVHVIAIDVVNNVKSIIGVESTYGGDGTNIARFSLQSKTFDILSPESSEPKITASQGVAVDSTRNRILVSSGGQSDESDSHSVISVDYNSGVHSIFSSNTIGQGEGFTGALPNGRKAGLFHLAVGKEYLYLAEYPNKIFKIDLENGNRSLVNNVTYHNATERHQLDVAYGAMQYQFESELLYAIENFRNAIFVIDTQTNERVILSKSKNDY